MDVDETNELTGGTPQGPLLYQELTSWHSLPVATRHQVLLVELGTGGAADLLLDESELAWPPGGLGVVRALVEKAQLTADPDALAECLDRFDVGLVPRLLRLGISHRELVPDILSLLVFLMELLPEIGAEVFRTHLHVLWHLGKTGLPEEEAAVAAAHAEAACHFALSAVGDHADRHELDCEEESWMGFCKAHYVIRFSSEPCAVPAGGAPPRAALRVAAFGSASESLQDRVHGCPLQTGGRLWVSELLLARELLARPLAGQVVLELGCGVGVAGIAAASRAAGCILTDVEPGVLEAAALNLRYTGGPACAGKVELLDLRNLEAVSCLALACRATVVIAADLIYGAVSQEEVARAVRAALPHGGSALLLMPQHYRPGMEKDGFGQALVSAGMETVSVRPVAAEGLHSVLAADEELQEYLLYEAQARPLDDQQDLCNLMQVSLTI